MNRDAIGAVFQLESRCVDHPADSLAIPWQTETRLSQRAGFSLSLKVIPGLARRQQRGLAGKSIFRPLQLQLQ